MFPPRPDVLIDVDPTDWTMRFFEVGAQPEQFSEGHPLREVFGPASWSSSVKYHLPLPQHLQHKNAVRTWLETWCAWHGLVLTIERFRDGDWLEFMVGPVEKAQAAIEADRYRLNFREVSDADYPNGR